MELDDFITLLDRVNRANTIPEVVELLAEIDSTPNLDKKERRILDECLDESVDVALLHDRWGEAFEKRYGGNTAVSGSVFTDATPETIIVNGMPTEVYRGK
jgi:hypothetical protein